MRTLAWAPFGRPETGWESRSRDPAGDPDHLSPQQRGLRGGARELAEDPRLWEPDGVLTEVLFLALKGEVQGAAGVRPLHLVRTVPRTPRT